jgi:hypothetical protein
MSTHMQHAMKKEKFCSLLHIKNTGCAPINTQMKNFLSKQKLNDFIFNTK